jgi:iron complex outermembrane receptor protein
MSKDQNLVFPTETRTAGYTTFNATGPYTITPQHLAQIISVTGFNLGDRLYRNNLSFIKEFAPEIGRGVKLTYTVRFFWASSGGHFSEPDRPPDRSGPEIVI